MWQYNLVYHCWKCNEFWRSHLKLLQRSWHSRHFVLRLSSFHDRAVIHLTCQWLCITIHQHGFTVCLGVSMACSFQADLFSINHGPIWIRMVHFQRTIDHVIHAKESIADGWEINGIMCVLVVERWWGSLIVKAFALHAESRVDS